MTRQDAESTYRDYEGDWMRDYEMLRGIAAMTHRTEDELAESWYRTRREWAVAMLMEADS